MSKVVQILNIVVVLMCLLLAKRLLNFKVVRNSLTLIDKILKF